MVSNLFRGKKKVRYEEPSKSLSILLIFVPRTKETDQPEFVEFVNKYFVLFSHFQSSFTSRLIHFTINPNTLVAGVDPSVVELNQISLPLDFF